METLTGTETVTGKERERETDEYIETLRQRDSYI